MYVGGGVTRKVMQFLYALQGLKSFHPYPILLVGLALGANSPGALVIRVLGLHHQKKKNVGVSAHKGGLFLAQRLTLSLN